MTQGRLLAVALLGLLAVLTLASTLYTVDQREKVIVVRFGQILRYDDPPGLHIKVPFVDQVRHFDARVLTLDADPQSFLTLEKKPVIVDSFVKWRVLDAQRYFLSVGGKETEARLRLEQFINSGLRDEFGKRTLKSVVSVDRAKIMQIMTEYADREARRFGIQVIDVRLQRVDLPEGISKSVYDRMTTERASIANDLRAKGAEVAEKIRADAERQREVLVSSAYRQAEQIRGEGDARATATYATAYGQAPEFYEFYRSLNAYKESFRKKDDIMILDPSADFFKYMKKPTR
jgi:membrane protease subunit HflC